mmetsp:Transcript_24053/g.48570  ORF Transcript_24053/g.48570 Transcript_24053/m.48570 type:complete len:205 (-) Transcript_24053:759-1373(-)
MEGPLIFKSLLILMQNEKNSPEILPYDFSLILFFWEIMSYQDNLIRNEITDINSINLSNTIKRIELDRLIYVLKSYHRYRIWKIEKTIDLSCKIFSLNRLSFGEKIFTRTYSRIIKTCQKKSLFCYLPEFLKLEKNKINYFNRAYIEKKNQNLVVFFRVVNKKKFSLENILSVEDPRGFYKDAIYAMKYKSIRRLVFSGIIFLI